MASRSYTALDHTNFTRKLSKKDAKYSLVDLQHVTYVPAQPVLSCRTVDIDLPGTRTYRQKSNLDILKEHQRLIQKLYQKPRISSSAPPRGREITSTRPSSGHTIGKVNIEIKGRPLTPGLPLGSYHTQNNTTTGIALRRPKTGQLKHVRPVTDCYLVVTEDQDLLADTQSNQELSNKLHSYWTTEKNNLATGKFIRGQKHPDDVPPTLDSWLTFGGAVGQHSDGVIDAFANVQNSEGYYNIKGSVGSKVARQLQKGDKIRIGINGILNTQELKVRKWNKDKTSDTESISVNEEAMTDVDKKVKEGLHLQKDDSEKELRKPGTESTKQEEMQESEEVKQTGLVPNDPSPASSSDDDDFKDLMISALDDFQEHVMGMEVNKYLTPRRSEMDVDEIVDSPVSNDEAVREAVRLTTPLSWSDQCSKPDIKVLHARLANIEVYEPVASETFPVRFEKLIDDSSMPKLSEVVSDGYKVKQRSAQIHNDMVTSKVKVIYIDPLTKQEEDTVNELSIENIIKYSLQGRNQEYTALSVDGNVQDSNDKNTSRNSKHDIPFQSQRNKFTRSGSRSNCPPSSSSWSNDRDDVHNPKLKVASGNSSTNHLRIINTGAQITKSVLKTARPPGKLIPAKPLHRTLAGQGSSIKSGGPQGETEYIKITSQLKFSPVNVPVTSLSHRSTAFSLSQISREQRRPQDLDYQATDNIHLEGETDQSSPLEADTKYINNIDSSRKLISSSDDDSYLVIDENDNNEDNEEKAVLPAATTAPTFQISIPTADDESICNSFFINETSSDLTVKHKKLKDIGRHDYIH